ncbi:MAG: 2Fe-2S iron-sulfur cluster-binding protein, partial [Planctomycetota bacterium]
MPTVEFLPFGLCAEVSPGTELLEAARRAGVELDAFCGGQGTCGTCLVRVATGRVDMDASVPAAE